MPWLCGSSRPHSLKVFGLELVRRVGGLYYVFGKPAIDGRTIADHTVLYNINQYDAVQ